MQFGDFEIHASPFIARATCKNCGNYCKQVSNGFLSAALYCSDCEIVYQIKMIKVPDGKVSKEFLEQCKKETRK